MLLQLVYATLSWTLLLFILQTIVNRRCSLAWNNRIIALLHSFLGCRWIEYNFRWPLDPSKMSGTNEWWEHTLLLFTCSYFLFDLIYCLWTQSEENYMLIHHVLGLAIAGYALFGGMCGYESALGFWITELANPLLQIRWFLRTMEWHLYLLYKVNEMLFVVVFLFNRVVVASVYGYIILFCSNCFLFIKVVCVFVHIFNFFFASQIIGMAMRRFKESKIEAHQQSEGETVDHAKVE